jgi:pimeloyl-ACP methyl ester carboxylesterase
MIHGMRLSLITAGVAAAALVFCVTDGTTIAAPRPAEEPCAPVPGAQCGTITVPLIRSRPDSGDTSVAYALIRGRNTSEGTVAINPGGPGDSAIGYASQYAQEYAGLLEHHDLLLIDPRGVNRSTPIDCGFSDLPATRDGLVRSVGECGQALGARARGYTSAEIADDIDAVRDRLGIGRLDLLGESYGTYLMTVYAQRHPTHVRSLVLSSAYPLAFDMWARPNVRAARRAIDLVCRRSAGACDGDQVMHDIAHLAQRLRHKPIPYELDGVQRLLDDTSLSSIVYDAASKAPADIGDIPAMAHTALHGDTALLVEAARRVTPMSGSTLRVSDDEQPFNPAVAAAVVCNDYPTLWDRAAPIPTRLKQFTAARGALPELTYWPFGKKAWTSAIIDQGNTCIRWPGHRRIAQPTDGPFPDVPTLVVSGDLDTNTPTESGRLAARQFRHSTVLEVPNLGHVAEREPSGCVAGIQTDFIRTLKVGGTACLAKIPPAPVQRLP